MPPPPKKQTKQTKNKLKCQFTGLSPIVCTFAVCSECVKGASTSNVLSVSRTRLVGTGYGHTPVTENVWTGPSLSGMLATCLLVADCKPLSHEFSI